MIRYRGDLSKMTAEALTSVDLSSITLVDAEETVRDTTVSMAGKLHHKIKAVAGQRRSSMNIIMNSALAHWLAANETIRRR